MCIRDRGLTLGGKDVAPNVVPVARYSQADFTVRLDDPAGSEKYAELALDALVACGTKCPSKDQQDIINAIGGIARVFHFVYATANDIRYYEPANKLYLAVIPKIM